MLAQNAPSTNKRSHLDIPAISREAHGAVVSIVASDKNGHPVAQGSGFLISKDGQVVTNYHFIRNGSSDVIKFPDGGGNHQRSELGERTMRKINNVFPRYRQSGGSSKTREAFWASSIHPLVIVVLDGRRQHPPFAKNATMTRPLCWRNWLPHPHREGVRLSLRTA